MSEQPRESFSSPEMKVKIPKIPPLIYVRKVIIVVLDILKSVKFM